MHSAMTSLTPTSTSRCRRSSASNTRRIRSSSTCITRPELPPSRAEARSTYRGAFRRPFLFKTCRAATACVLNRRRRLFRNETEGALSPTSPERKHAQDRVPALDLLRLLAALAVVVFHYAYRGAAADEFTKVSLPILEPVAKYGWFGVELFFVISGFVIAWSALGRTAVDFGIARAARLWPAFVACTTVTFVVTYCLGAPPFETSFVQWAANLTMLAPAFGQPFMDGSYWSIVLEIVFYGWMALFVALGLFPRRVDELVLALLSIALA